MGGKGLSQGHSTAQLQRPRTPDPTLTSHIPQPQEFLLLPSAGAKVLQQARWLTVVGEKKSTSLGFKIRLSLFRTHSRRGGACVSTRTQGTLVP